MQIALVGLPNVGKSTLFNALTKSQGAEAANFPFCTIEPNIGVIPIKDERLQKIAEIAGSKKIIFETIKFVDVAGLVKGASRGEGLGNKFLSHIRECDAVAMVLRFFEDGNITHVAGKVDPKNDMETIETELILADLATAEKVQAKAQSSAKSGKAEDKLRLAAIEKVYAVLAAGQRASMAELDEEEVENLKDLNFLSAKKFIFVANVSEKSLKDFDIEKAKTELGISAEDVLIAISARIEEELVSLSPEEQNMFLEDLGIQTDGLQLLAKAAHQALGLACYFTAGEQEARAWNIPQNCPAPEAAGKIHTDFQKGFISVDKLSATEFIEHHGWKHAREKGLVKNEGKDYLVQDGDVCLFKFNV